MPLPPDNHVHTEWSWDTAVGSMDRSCAKAVELGLPSIAFTEHVDLTRWVIPPEIKTLFDAALVGQDGHLDPPVMDSEGYLACVQECRERYPGLRILSGVELGEPHWFAGQSKTLLAGGDYDRVLGSLHSLEVEGTQWIVDALFADYAPTSVAPDGIVRDYLAEAVRMIESSDLFAVLAHIDYPLRGWPGGPTAFDPTAFEEEYRAVLQALARSGRALEVNTRVENMQAYMAQIVRWWHDVGGEAVSFGSDAHEPSVVALRFAEAAAMVEAQGFRPGREPHDFWLRS